jgi:hypothetical protein
VGGFALLELSGTRLELRDAPLRSVETAGTWLRGR